MRTLREQDKPTRYLISRLLWKTGLCRLIIIDKGTFKLRFYPSSTSTGYWYNLDFRKVDENLLANYLKKNDIVIDVGANIGTLTLKAASIVGEEGKVFSIEAHPTTFKFLKGNIFLNRKFTNIEAFNVAIGDRKGTAAISDKVTRDDQNQIVPEGEINVDVETLDGLFDDIVKRVDFLKIDVEGYEKFVLLGADQVLKKTKCVYIESWESHFINYGYSTTDIFEILHSSGFRVFRLVDLRLVETSSSYISEVVENLLAIRDLGDFTERTNITLAD